MMKVPSPYFSNAAHSRRLLGAVVFTIIFLTTSIFSLYQLQWLPEPDFFRFSPGGQPAPPNPEADYPGEPFSPELDANPFYQTIKYFKDYEFNERPYQQHFGEQGARTKLVRNWLVASKDTTDPELKQTLQQSVEDAIQVLFPFMRDPPQNPSSPTPFADLLSRYTPGSTGIVLTAGDPIVRFAAHLILSLRSVLNSTLPIQIFYAGDADLSPSKREWLSSLLPTSTTTTSNSSSESSPSLEFIDIHQVFDPSTLQFDKSHGGWALKPFALLASRFEKTILLDADAVLLQPPEAFFSHPAFLRSGALLFHDRLLWKGGQKGRHAFWRENIKRPGKELAKSLVWTEGYTEEGDSGVVVMDKGREDVLMGLMHVCWQNLLEVRESTTYKVTYGDKESW